MSTNFATAATGTGQQGSVHTCDGSTVHLTAEAGAGKYLFKRVTAFNGMLIRCNRTSTTIEFEMRFKGADWQPFEDNNGILTVDSAVAAHCWAIDP